MEKQTNIPSLRFPEFSGDWVINLLSDIAEKRIIKNKDNKVKNVFTNSAIHGIVNQRDFFDKDIANQNNLLGYYLVENNDFVYNPRISNCAPVGPISRNHLNTGIMSPLYSVFRFKTGNQDFIEMYFSTTIWHKHMEDIANYGARDDRMSFLTGDFYRMPINLPTITEQTKIASFLTKVDEKLTALKKKKELLVHYKKGIMQQIFSQELRFKNDDESDYPDWEEKDLGTFSKITTGSSNREDSNLDGEYTFFDRSQDIRSSNRYLFDAEAIIVPGEGQEFIPKFFIGKFDLHQRTYAIMDFGSNIGKYLYYFISFNSNHLNSHAVGSTVKSLRLPMFEKMPIKLPCNNEQCKIANFLTTIDNKISYCHSQIEKAEVWKKGLLQQMFC